MIFATTTSLQIYNISVNICENLMMVLASSVLPLVLCITSCKQPIYKMYRNTYILVQLKPMGTKKNKCSPFGVFINWTVLLGVVHHLVIQFLLNDSYAIALCCYVCGFVWCFLIQCHLNWIFILIPKCKERKAIAISGTHASQTIFVKNKQKMAFYLSEK